jgi:iron-sulfur cluster assembly protein
MIKLTAEAARQIIAAAEQGQMTHLSLRLAARRGADGAIEYGMGFDEVKDEDLSFNCEGIEVIMDPQFEGLLNGATLDFVELEPGDFRFIFLNPNDPHFAPPGEGAEQGGCGSSGNTGGGCGSGGCGSGGCGSH